MGPPVKKTKRPAGQKVDLEAELGELYGRPLDQFISHRDQLVKRLRESGERAEATEVGRLRKPSISAWAVNQAVRDDARAAKRLIGAAERLEAAQAAIMRGADRTGLRAAMSEEQEAVEAITDAAAAALEASGSGGGATLDRVRKTLRAVAGDPDLAAELSRGRVTSDHEAVGFGAAVAMPAPARRSNSKTDSKRSSDSKAGSEAKRQSAAAEEKKRRQAAERAVKSAEAKLAAASKRVEAAQTKRDRVATALEDAQDKLEAAERERGQRVDDLVAAKDAT